MSGTGSVDPLEFDDCMGNLAYELGYIEGLLADTLAGIGLIAMGNGQDAMYCKFSEMQMDARVHAHRVMESAVELLKETARKRGKDQLTDSDADSAPHSDPLSAPHSDTDSGRYKIR